MFSLFKKKVETRDILIPDEEFALVSSTYDGLPAKIVVNTALRKFKDKDIFGWTCSLIMDYENLGDNGMPTNEESQLVIDYLDGLSKRIIGDPVHPNALFLARVSNNGTCHVLWQANDPKPIDELLKGIINDKTYPRAFDFRIEYDEKWEGVSWFLQEFK